MKVLIVDDDDAIRGLIALIVKSQGHEMALASDGLEGLKSFKTFQPDIIFSDIQMPNMNGLQMLKEIRLLDSDAIFINAIEHGNLEFTYSEKSQILEEDPERWEKNVEARSLTPPYSNRQITINFKMDSERLEWVITDEGPGFDWRIIPDPNDPANLAALHGRGILLAKMQFDECVFVGRGNQVRLVKHLTGKKG